MSRRKDINRQSQMRISKRMKKAIGIINMMLRASCWSHEVS